MTRPTILVTGGAKRIGSRIARRFAAAGWHVVIHYGQSREQAEALATELPYAETISCDLADTAAALEMVEHLAGRLPDWRMLVNSAAVFRFDDGAALDRQVFDEAIAVNARTPAALTQAFLAHARASGGRRVINLTDMKLANPNPDFFSYTMAKAALAAATRIQAMATPGPDRIYALAPGAMLPSHDQQEAEHETSGRMNLLERLTDADELAHAALFLSEGWLASGETLYVDSGQHLLSQPRDVLYLARS
jgi:NAD(P)-dependent dehydrogenase (short-subunit alcohol dehydrogenase family)